MKVKLLQLEQRVSELETLADEVGVLAEQLTKTREAQPALSNKGQAWFRGARELLVQHKSSALGELDACYIRWHEKPNWPKQRAACDIEKYLNLCLGGGQIPTIDYYNGFVKEFKKARSLVLSVSVR